MTRHKNNPIILVLNGYMPIRNKIYKQAPKKKKTVMGTRSKKDTNYNSTIQPVHIRIILKGQSQVRTLTQMSINYDFYSTIPMHSIIRNIT